MSQNRLQLKTGLFRSTNSTAANTSATSASCQNNANGVQTDHGSSRPATTSSLATTSVPNSASVFMYPGNGVLECRSVAVSPLQLSNIPILPCLAGTKPG